MKQTQNEKGNIDCIRLIILCIAVLERGQWCNSSQWAENVFFSVLLMNCLILFSVGLITNIFCIESKLLIPTKKYIYFLILFCVCATHPCDHFFSLSNTILSGLTAVFRRLALSATLRSGHAASAPDIALCTAPEVLSKHKLTRELAATTGTQEEA